MRSMGSTYNGTDKVIQSQVTKTKGVKPKVKEQEFAAGEPINPVKSEPFDDSEELEWAETDRGEVTFIPNLGASEIIADRSESGILVEMTQQLVEQSSLPFPRP